MWKHSCSACTFILRHKLGLMETMIIVSRRVYRFDLVSWKNFQCTGQHFCRNIGWIFLSLTLQAYSDMRNLTGWEHWRIFNTGFFMVLWILSEKVCNSCYNLTSLDWLTCSTHSQMNSRQKLLSAKCSSTSFPFLYSMHCMYIFKANCWYRPISTAVRCELGCVFVSNHALNI